MHLIESPPGAYTVVDGRRYAYFVGTGYLGLQGHPDVIRAACRAAEQYGIGSATSRSGFGTTAPLLEVEARAASCLQAEDAFYFATGYAGNAILMQALDEAFDAVFVDEMAHYSIVDAARQSGKPLERFRHRDAEDLRRTLRSKLAPGHRPLVASDGVFAARGTIVPVADYTRAVIEYPGAALLVDDAHGLGVLGEQGTGTFEHAGMDPGQVNRRPGENRAPHGPGLFACATLSKAAGGYGGIVAGSSAFIGHVKKVSPWCGGASPMPPPVAAATARALELLAGAAGLRRQLWENVRRMKSGARELGLPVDDTPVPILCLEIGRAEDMRRIQQELMDRGILVAYMPSYSGLGPQGAIRVAVFATHSAEMIQELLDALRQLL